MFGRKPFGFQTKQITYNVYKYYKKRKICKDTEEYLLDINLAEKVAEVTGICKNSVGNIIREGNNMELDRGRADFQPNDKKVERKKKVIIGYILEGIIRRKAIKHGSIKKVQEDLQEENILTCCKETLRRVLHKLGFTSVGSFRLIEPTEIVTERLNYLKALKYFREQDRPIFYLSETKRWKCVNDCMYGLKEMPTYVMVCTSGTQKFLDKTNLMFKVKSHDECFDHFENYDWMKDVVLRNLPCKSVIVINIPYCEMPESIMKDKSSDTSKTSLQDFLKRHNIPYNENDSESELLELINNQDAKMEYSITKIIKDGGHEVIYLPENHLDLDPAAIMWQDIKNSAENVSNIQMATDLFTNYTMEKLEECLDYVKENEGEYYSYSTRKYGTKRQFKKSKSHIGDSIDSSSS